MKSKTLKSLSALIWDRVGGTESRSRSSAYASTSVPSHRTVPGAFAAREAAAGADGAAPGEVLAEPAEPWPGAAAACEADVEGTAAGTCAAGGPGTPDLPGTSRYAPATVITAATRVAPAPIQAARCEEAGAATGAATGAAVGGGGMEPLCCGHLRAAPASRTRVPALCSLFLFPLYVDHDRGRLPGAPRPGRRGQRPPVRAEYGDVRRRRARKVPG